MKSKQYQEEIKALNKRQEDEIKKHQEEIKALNKSQDEIINTKKKSNF